MYKLLRKIRDSLVVTNSSNKEILPGTKRYTQFRITLLIAITIIALIPSTLLSVLSYLRYLDIAQRQSATHIRWHLQYVADNIEKHFSSLQSIVETTAEQLLPIHFESRSHLEILLEDMRNEEESLLKIDLLSLTGSLLTTTAEHLQPDINYAAAEWFIEIMENDLAISKMYGSPPIFTIATKVKTEAPRSELVCTMTFAGNSLEDSVKRINAGAMEDAFLIDSEGVLQSTSTYFGERGKHFRALTAQAKPGFLSVRKKWGVGSVFYTVAPIQKTPWYLVLVKDGPVTKKEWLTFQLSLVLIFLVCAAVSVIIIHQLVNILVHRIRESDTKRMALLNEVGHTNRLITIGKLAAGVAHEINNPLAVIDQKAGLIEDIMHLSENFDNREKIQQTIQGIHSSVDRCKVITHRLLGFARKMDSVNERIDINHVIAEVIGFLEKEAMYSHIFFHMHLQNNLPQLISDRGQLQQIFLNIVSNSIDAIGKNGNIHITTSLAKKGTILVKLQDDGPGIKSEIMEHIFDPFFTTKKTGEGTGLGLSITYGLINKLGGSIKVHSKIGGGATFIIYLPTHSFPQQVKNNGQNKGSDR